MIPRVVVAGTSSGAGKTTVACGLIGALRARGLTVQGFKVGPDYIDPSHHALASGRPGRNLDAFLSGPELIAPLVRHGSAGADIAVIEGVMGMFDGASGRGELASTAHVAKLLDAPVVLVVDAAAMARSAAAVVHGFRTFDPDVDVAGVIFNKVGSDIHEQLLREALEGSGVPVLGALRRDERVVTPERHLGLVPVAERESAAREALDALAEAMARHADLDELVRLARAAPSVDGPAWSPAAETQVAGGTRVAIARGPAFSFHYQENLELIEAAGAELVPFDPIADEALPDGAGALILAGGFPEVFGEQLAANARLRADGSRVRGVRAAGARRVRRPAVPVLGARRPRDVRRPARAGDDGRAADARLPRRRRDARRRRGSPRARPCAGTSSTTRRWSRWSADAARAWRLSTRNFERLDGVVSGGVQAGYLHVHWAAHPEIARAFAAAAADRAPAAA